MDYKNTTFYALVFSGKNDFVIWRIVSFF